MIRTQIQLPDALYRAAKELARHEERSLAEVIRRSLENLLCMYPRLKAKRGDWKLPGPFDLGADTSFFDNPDWRYEANISGRMADMVHEKSRTKYGKSKK